MAAYVVVYKDWQKADKPNPRGHNIGCILVDSNNNPVAWNRNSNGITNDSTQHGEVRIMQGYIKSSGNKYLKGYTVYTTLEPCAMCSGMMGLTEVTRTVYGQNDWNYPAGGVGYGRAIERLKLNSTALPNGFPPYPRMPDSSDPSPSKVRELLDSKFSQGKWTDITVFLTSGTAKAIYIIADALFTNFTPQFPENKAVYDNTVAFIKTIP